MKRVFKPQDVDEAIKAGGVVAVVRDDSAEDGESSWMILEDLDELEDVKQIIWCCELATCDDFPFFHPSTTPFGLAGKIFFPSDLVIVWEDGFWEEPVSRPGDDTDVDCGDEEYHHGIRVVHQAADQ